MKICHYCKSITNMTRMVKDGHKIWVCKHTIKFSQDGMSATVQFNRSECQQKALADGYTKGKHQGKHL
jgi:hypothetical protein